jgi:hypothetical protein
MLGLVQAYAKYAPNFSCAAHSCRSGPCRAGSVKPSAQRLRWFEPNTCHHVKPQVRGPFCDVSPRIRGAVHSAVGCDMDLKFLQVSAVSRSCCGQRRCPARQIHAQKVPAAHSRLRRRRDGGVSSSGRATSATAGLSSGSDFLPSPGALIRLLGPPTDTVEAEPARRRRLGNKLATLGDGQNLALSLRAGHPPCRFGTLL